MLRNVLCILTLLFLLGCGAKKKRTYSKNRTPTITVEGSIEEAAPPKISRKEERKNTLVVKARFQSHPLIARVTVKTHLLRSFSQQRKKVLWTSMPKLVSNQQSKNHLSLKSVPRQLWTQRIISTNSPTRKPSLKALRRARKEPKREALE